MNTEEKKVNKIKEFWGRNKKKVLTWTGVVLGTTVGGILLAGLLGKDADEEDLDFVFIPESTDDVTDTGSEVTAD